MRGGGIEEETSREVLHGERSLRSFSWFARTRVMSPCLFDPLSRILMMVQMSRRTGAILSRSLGRMRGRPRLARPPFLAARPFATYTRGKPRNFGPLSPLHRTSRFSLLLLIFLRTIVHRGSIQFSPVSFLWILGLSFTSVSSPVELFWRSCSIFIFVLPSFVPLISPADSPFSLVFILPWFVHHLLLDSSFVPA